MNEKKMEKRGYVESEYDTLETVFSEVHLAVVLVKKDLHFIVTTA